MFTILLAVSAGCGVTAEEGTGGTGSTGSPSTAGASTASSTTTARSTTDRTGSTTASSTTASSTTASTTTTQPATTTTGAGPAGDAVCRPLRTISDLDKQFSGELSGNADWPTVQATLIDVSGRIVVAYEDAIAEAPDDLVDDLTKVRDFTRSTIAVARSSTSFDDFVSKVSDDPAVLAAGQAAIAIDTFARSTCGFSTSNE